MGTSNCTIGLEWDFYLWLASILSHRETRLRSLLLGLYRVAPLNSTWCSRELTGWIFEENAGLWFILSLLAGRKTCRKGPAVTHFQTVGSLRTRVDTEHPLGHLSRPSFPGRRLGLKLSDLQQTSWLCPFCLVPKLPRVTGIVLACQSAPAVGCRQSPFSHSSHFLLNRFRAHPHWGVLVS